MITLTFQRYTLILVEWHAKTCKNYDVDISVGIKFSCTCELVLSKQKQKDLDH